MKEALQVIGTEQLINLHAQAAGEVPESRKQVTEEATQLPGRKEPDLSDPSSPLLQLRLSRAHPHLPFHTSLTPIHSSPNFIPALEGS